MCDELAKKEHLDIIQPFDTIETIEGQGSLGMEIKDQLGEVESLFVSVGGGGLASGLALALPSTTIYLVEPEGKELNKQVKRRKRRRGRNGMNSVGRNSFWRSICIGYCS